MTLNERDITYFRCLSPIISHSVSICYITDYIISAVYIVCYILLYNWQLGVKLLLPE